MLTALFISPDVIFTKKEKRKIETYIQKYIKNDLDTTELYKWSAFKLSFYEFVVRDYKKSIKVINDFESKIPYEGLLDFSFPAMRFDSRIRIMHKGKFKEIKKKNSWQSKEYMIAIDSLRWESNHKTLLFDILKDIPTDLNFDTYFLILSILRHEKVNKDDLYSFIFRMIEANNINVVLYLLKVWNFNNDSIPDNLSLHGLVSYAISLHREKMASCILSVFPTNIQYDAKFKSTQLSQLLPLDNLKNLCIISSCKNDNSLGLGYSTGTLDAIKKIWGDFSNEYKFASNNVSAPLFLVRPREKQIADINIRIKNSTINNELSADIMTVLNQLYGQYLYLEVCEKCKLYERYITQNCLGLFYNIWGLSEARIGLYNEGLKHLRLAEKYSPKDITITQNIGYVLCEIGRYNDALDIYNSYIGSKDDDFETFYTFDQLGYIYSHINRDESIKFYKKATKFIDNESFLFIEKKIRHFLRYSRAVSFDKYMQRKYIEKAKLCVTNAPYGVDSISLGAIYVELGNYYNSISDYNQANHYYLLAFECMKKLTQEDKLIRDLKLNYSHNLIDNNSFIQAKDILYELKETITRVLGQEHIEYIATIRSLLKIAIELHDKNRATELFNELEVLSRLFPEESVLYENIEARMMWHNFSNNPKALIEDLKEILSLKELTPRIISTISSYLLVIDVDYSEFMPILKNLIKRIQELSIIQLVSTSSSDWHNIVNPLNVTRSNLINSTNNKVDLVAYGAEFSLFTKGLLFNTKKRIEQSLSFNEKSTIELIHQIKQKKDSVNIAFTKEDFVKIPSIIDEIGILERDLYNQYVNSEDILKKLNFEYRDICSSIGKDGLGIDFVRYSRNKIVKYAAYVYSQKLRFPLFIPICDENDIKRRIVGKNSNIDYSFYRNRQNKGDFHNLIWSKLIPYFADCHDIYFSGDGLLNQLAIELVCDENDTQICDKYRLHRVFHLADIKNTQDIGDHFMAIGVSDHNSPVENILEKDRGTWSDLLGVNKELEIISNKFKQFNSDCRTSYIMNDMAREQYVKSLDGEDITTLHIATHGFYKDKFTLEKAASDSLNFDYNISIRTLKTNKESLSGLILRQGNLSWKSSTIKDKEDDILTSDEIENLTFPKLKLTILSACETGLGNTNSEGVWGLQRAFRIAGTESLICSLCKIDDEWIAKFMDVFYEQVNKGRTIYDSFHEARLFLFKNKKKESKIWSSMILIE